MAKVREQTSAQTGGEVVAPRPSLGDLVARVGQGLPWRRSPTPSSTGQAPANTAKAANAANAPNAAATPRRRSDMSRLLIGLLVYMVGSYLIQYLLGLANGLWGLHLERPQNLFPTNWWLVGQMSRASLIYLMALIALIWLLYRTNLIPRDLFAPRRAAGQANATTTTTVTTGRRRSSRRSATGTSTTTTTHTATSARRAAAARAPATPGTHDLEYGRVRALQRARRRKR